MTPQECKRSINDIYEIIMKRVAKGEVNKSAVYRVVEAQAKDAARHNGIPECWEEYMPLPLRYV